jgi:hypothetical protein
MPGRIGALIPALDSIRINNTGQTPDETFAVFMGHVRERLGTRPENSKQG